MINEFKAIFANNYIKVGRKVIRPFSFAWWCIQLSKVLIGVLSFYLLYCSLWMLAA
jgi:hypothetical protein